MDVVGNKATVETTPLTEIEKLRREIKANRDLFALAILSQPGTKLKIDRRAYQYLPEAKRIIRTETSEGDIIFTVDNK